MDEFFQKIIASVEPLPDPIYGPRYRCALTLKDGTNLPCAVLQSRAKLVELAKRRLKEESSWKKRLSADDSYARVLSSFLSAHNRVADYEVAACGPSKFAPPVALGRQIRGETTMGWTGWVFEMKDGRMFAYGSSYHMEFLDLPEGYGFGDVAKVHNHSFLSAGGALMNLVQGGALPARYPAEGLLKARVFFTCYIDGI